MRTGVDIALNRALVAGTVDLREVSKRALSPVNVATALHRVAALRGPTSALPALVAAVPRVWSAGVREIVQVAWACARLKVKKVVWVSAVEDRLPDLGTADLAACAWALGHARSGSSLAGIQVSPLVATAKPRDIANLVWALTVTSSPPGAVQFSLSI